MKSILKFKLLAASLLLPIALSAGCSEREVLDVETPGGEVEVTEDTDTGEIDVDVKEK